MILVYLVCIVLCLIWCGFIASIVPDNEDGGFDTGRMLLIIFGIIPSIFFMIFVITI